MEAEPIIAVYFILGIGLLCLVAVIYKILRSLRTSPIPAVKEMPEVQVPLQETRPAVTLNPKPAEAPLPPTESKFGGAPEMSNFKDWPRCPACDSPMNFVLQLSKTDSPEMYFPEGSDFFQLFRCPNFQCPRDFEMHSDHELAWFYSRVIPGGTKVVPKPAHSLKEAEDPVPECSLHPARIVDHPASENFSRDYQRPESIEAWKLIEAKYGNKGVRRVEESIPSAKECTKIGGYPSWIQSPGYPQCKCGAQKEFFFQLSSRDSEDLPRKNRWEFSPHGIMIADVGNIYFFVCRRCGAESIETDWDCG